MVVIRPAGPGDDGAVAALITEYAEAFAYELGDQDVEAEGRNARARYETGALLVAEHGGAVVGCVAYEPWGPGRARMKRMYVLDAARGLGVGRQLAQAIVDAARDAGCTTMLLDTTQGMVAARGLYASMGFREWEPDYVAPCNDTVYMTLDL